MSFWKVFPQLETDRLLLKEVDPSDANEYLKLFQNEEVRKYVVIEPPKNAEESRRWLDNYRKKFVLHQGVRWTIWNKKTHTFMGTIALKSWDHDHHNAEIGYSLIEDMWGKGFATEAIEKVTKWAAKETDLHLIYTHTLPDNIASYSVLLKNGYEVEGELIDRVFYKGEFFSIKMLSKVLG